MLPTIEQQQRPAVLERLLYPQQQDLAGTFRHYLFVVLRGLKATGAGVQWLLTGCRRPLAVRPACVMGSNHRLLVEMSTSRKHNGTVQPLSERPGLAVT